MFWYLQQNWFLDSDLSQAVINTLESEDQHCQVFDKANKCHPYTNKAEISINHGDNLAANESFFYMNKEYITNGYGIDVKDFVRHEKN